MRKSAKLLATVVLLPLLLSGCIISPWSPYYDDEPGYHHHDHGRWHDDRGYGGRWYDDRGYGRR